MAEYTLKIKADPSPTIEMFRLLAECHRENADQFDRMCDRLAAKWAEQNPEPDEAAS